MNRRRPADNAVLTDYVRERLDRAVAPVPADRVREEANLRTVVRPRPALGPPPEDAADVDGTDGRNGMVATRANPFTRRHLLVVAAILALGALIAGYALTRARAVPVEVTPVVAAESPPAAGGSTPAGPPATASATPVTVTMRIHVTGEVTKPGVHRLPAGARVADAIEAAGGLTPAAKPGELNLAQSLADGQQVIVGGGSRASEVRGGDGAGSAPAGAGGSTAGGGGASAGGAAAGGKVNLNTATAAQLDSLPGVGPVTAEKILAWRTQHGRFTRVEELQEVPGIGPKSFAEIAPHVTI